MKMEKLRKKGFLSREKKEQVKCTNEGAEVEMKKKCRKG